MAADENWADLAGVIRRILAGERATDLLTGLDSTDTLVVRTILDGIASDHEPDGA